MPEDNTTNPTNQTVPPSVPTPSDVPTPDNATVASPVDDTIVDPTVPPETPPDETAAPKSVYSEVISKISDSKNVLIALSSDPSVDEMAAAIGLSLYLDKLGKRATAIYSGATPNALEFLKPEETFEPTADTLQDFVVALNKDKADHLRYKLDGDFVKIYITPYKTRITEEDLDFSYGDFNVDLVLALDVANGIDLDSALREHGRIMHDAVIVNITTGKPGKFGEIEWSDKNASSVSEMVANLLYNIKSDVKIEKDEATAFLTGIVAATNRFSNSTTTPETMKIASKLMESGANQQLVSQNITSDVENESPTFSVESKPQKEDRNPTELEIEHEDEPGKTGEENIPPEAEEKVDEGPEKPAEIKSELEPEKPVEQPAEQPTESADNSLLEDLQAAADTLSHAGAETTPESDHTALKIDSEPDSTSSNIEPAPEVITNPTEPVSKPNLNNTEDSATEVENQPSSDTAPFSSAEISSAEQPAAEQPAEPTPTDTDGSFAKPEKVIQPSPDLSEGLASGDAEVEQNKYGQMLEDALNSVDDTPQITTPAENPATMSAPSVPTNPEINGVPEINYMPNPGEDILPPPPAPPIDVTNGASVMPTPAATQPIEPAAPVTQPAPEPLGPQPAMQDQVYSPQASDPNAFKIPGM